MNKILNAYNIYSQAKDSDLVGMQWGPDISILKALQIFSGAARVENSSVGWHGESKNKSVCIML